MKRQLAARPTLFPAVFRRAFDPTRPLDKMRSNMSQSGFIVSKSLYIYVAGPCFTSAELAFNRMLAAELQRLGHTVYLPQDFVETHLDIKQQCLDKMDSANLMVAILDGPDVDSGTAYEVGYWQACWPDARILAYRSDIRRGGDTDKNVNAMLADIKTYSALGELLNAIDQL